MKITRIMLALNSVIQMMALTRKGEILSKSYLKYGGILDASHTRNNSFYEMINISRQFQSSIGLPAQFFLITQISMETVSFSIISSK